MTEIPNVVRKRLKAAQAGEHPDANLLTAFAEQALPDRERTQVLEHLALCADCRDVLAQATPPLSPAALPADKDTAGASKVAWLGWPSLRWGALAVCVVIVGTAVFVRHDLRQSRTAAYIKSDAVPPSDREATPAFSPASRDALIAKTLASEEKKQESDQRAKIERGRMMALASAKPSVPSSPPPPTSSPIDLTSRPEEYRYAGEGYLAPGQKEKSAQHAWKSAPAPVLGGVLAVPPPPTVGPTVRKDEAPMQPKVNLPLAGRNTRDVANGQPSPPPSQAVEVSGANETVEVQSAAVQAETTAMQPALKKATPGKAKGAAADASVVTLPASTTNYDEKVLTTAAETRASRLEAELAHSRLAPVSRWTISSDGELQHSIDAGKTWQPVTVADKATFRALSANGPEVWVGGPTGLLYHTSDSGGHWSQVKPVADGAPLSADIATIEFTDRLNGKLTTATGEIWTTADGGLTWHKQS